MRASKDAALGFAVRAFLNTRLSAIGEIAELSVDTRDQRAQLRLALRGEPRPLDVDIRKYALDQRNGRDWLTVLEVAASREWLDASLQQFVIGRRIPISPNAARILRLLT